LNNLGFNVYRAEEQDGKFSLLSGFRTDENLRGQGSSSRERDYSFRDTDVQAGHSYWYRLGDVDNSGRENFSKSVKVMLDNDAGTPLRYAVDQNYPNPFNPATTIRYSLPEKADVTLSVYDLHGRLVRTLVNGEQPAGEYALNFDGRNLAGGVYYFRMTAGNFREVRKMVLLR
jgi:hypothetical protein